MVGEANVPAVTIVEPATTRWESALSTLPRTKRHRFLRAYGDDVNGALLERWLPPGTVRRVLKTDLFEEAVGEGLTPYLAARADRVDAIDVSEAIATAASSRHPEITALLSDVRELPYENDTFDVAVSTSTLDHFDSAGDIAVALRELSRVLRPGGVLIVSLDNLANPLIALRNALPFTWLNRIGLVPYYVGVTCTPADLGRLLTEAGFDVQVTTAVMHVPRVAALALGRGARELMALERLERLPTRFLTGQFIAARAVRR
jgi:SAM-dependent methyltransferase